MNVFDFLNAPQLKFLSSRFFCVLFLSLITTSAKADVVYDDAVDGNASNNGLAPTVLVFDLGSNVVNGTVSAGDPDNARNFYTFSILPGQALSAIVFDSLSVVTSEGGPTSVPGFFALVSGSTSATPAAGFSNIGGLLFDEELVELNVLDGTRNGGSSSGTGFTTQNLGVGDYTFVIQQTGTEESTFSLDFQVVPVAVPEPTNAMILVGLGMLGLARRRRR